MAVTAQARLTIVRMLWEMRLSLWNHRNGMKHGKTPEEREENLRSRLRPQKRRAYADQYSRMTPTARRQLFGVATNKILKFRNKTTVRWLE